MCLPKKEGGLGLRSLWEIRRQCMRKLAWSFLNNNSLWASHAGNRFTLGKQGPKICNSVTPMIHKLVRESYWDIGDGGTGLKHFCIWLRVKVSRDFQNTSIKEIATDRCNLNKFLDHIPPSCMVFL